MLDFNCDRQDKADLTASTLSYIRSTGHYRDVWYYEKNKNGELVPFNSPEMYDKSRLDVYMSYGPQLYSFELKGRKFASEGVIFKGVECRDALFNPEKIDPIREDIRKGIISMWAETYTNDIIRLWNLKNIDATIGLDNLPITYEWIQEITIDPTSPKKLQPRLHLPYESGFTITKIRGEL